MPAPLPAYPADPLESRPLEGVATALAAMLDQHEPFPAVVMPRGWSVLRANRGAGELFG
jgi:MmyB-like transcription regulator ligand binding domain